MTVRLSEPRVLGVPVRDANAISYRRCVGYGIDGHDLLCWVTTAESGAHFCALDLTTEQLDIKALHHREGYPITPASDGAIYVGSTSGEVWRYRAVGSSWEVLARLWDTSAKLDIHHVRVLCEGSDGWLYGGSCYGERARVHPRTGEVQPLPAIQEKGEWYVSSVVPLPNGRIVFGLGYVARVLIYDPKLGQDVAEWAPDIWRHDGFILTMQAGPTVVYASHIPSNQRGAFDIATGNFLGVIPWPDAELFSKRPWTHSTGAGNSFDFYLLPGTDTIAANDGQLVHLWDPRGGARTLPLADFQPGPELAREMQFAVTMDLRVLEYDLGRTRVVREATFPQPPAERGLFGLGLGPDGCIYGGAFQSMHLLRFDPKNGELRDLGDHHPGWGGEIYSFCLRGDELVCASYVNGAVVVYDPARPWDCSYERQTNPRVAGCFGQFTYRPCACLTDHRGRVWGVGRAGWGTPGGGISWIDPDTGETGTSRLPDAPYSVSEPHPGTLLLADETNVYWWNTDTNLEQGRCNWPHGQTPAAVVVAIGPVSRIAFADSQGLHLARLPAPGKLEIERSFPRPIEIMRLLWDGRRLIAGGSGVAELDLESGQWTTLCDAGIGSQFAFVALPDALYFTRGAQLLAVPRPGR